MKEISDNLFEYLFEKIFREGIDINRFINRDTGKIILVNVGNRDDNNHNAKAFIIVGKTATDFYGNLVKNDSSLFYYLLNSKNLKIDAFHASEIKSLIEQVSPDVFLKEVEELYRSILNESAPRENKEISRKKNREIFYNILAEADKLDSELRIKENEGIIEYATRLSKNTAGSEIKEAIRLIRKADREISEIWANLRYLRESKYMNLIDKCIDSIISKCLERIDELGERFRSKNFM